MKVLHTSDWHLGMTGPSGDYAEDQQFFIEEIAKIAEAEGVDAIIIAGDVFDRGVASNEALKLYDAAMSRFCIEMKKQVLIVAGNHDGAERLASCNELLAMSGLHICGALSREPSIVSIGNTDFYLLPWITTEKVKYIYPEQAENVHSMEDAYRVVLDAYRAGFNPAQKHVLISHAFVAGSETSTSDRSAEIGRASQVGTPVFDGFDYVALGHIHGPQSVRKMIRYSGTPMPYSFGREEKQEKSVTILDTETMELRFAPIPLWRERHTLTGTYEELLKGAYKTSVKEGYVRLVVTDEYVGREMAARLYDVYPHMLEYTSPGYDSDDGTITMTIDELNEIEDDPEEVFKRFSREVVKKEPTEHFLELFRAAVQEYNEEVNA